MDKDRKEKYERRREELLKQCEICRKTQKPTYERCNYGCTTGKRLRWLETEYSDVTGWSHEKWGK